jgi:hypothetical protein
MIAFDYYVNGKKVRTAGIEGPGVVATNLALVRGIPAKKGKAAPEFLSLEVGGLHSLTHTHVTWLHRRLVQGDTVRIDVVDASKVDRARKKRSESPRSRLKREKDYVLKKAAAWGWIIQTTKPNPEGGSRAGRES